jgi:hypothetical protein
METVLLGYSRSVGLSVSLSFTLRFSVCMSPCVEGLFVKCIVPRAQTGTLTSQGTCIHAFIQ